MLEKQFSRRALLQRGALLGGLGVVGGCDASGVVTGRVRQLQEQVNVIGGHPMYCVDVSNSGHNPDETGPKAPIAEQWRFQTDGSVSSSVAVVNRTVYVGSRDTNVYALDAGDGSEQWHFETDGEVFSSPAVVDGTVYVGSGDNYVYALDAVDGTERWRFETGGAVYSSPVVAEGTVYVGSGDNHVYALSASDGSEQWRFQTDGSAFSSPAVVDGTVYVGSADSNGSTDGHLYAVDAASGDKQWAFQTYALVKSSPAVVDGTVYVGSKDQYVYALDAEDGTERWKFQTYGSVSSSPAVAGGTVYVGSEDTSVYALDAADGTKQWRFHTGGVVDSSPVVADGTVYIGSDDNLAYALDAADGTEQWRFQTDGSVSSSPAVVDGTVYVGSNDNNIHALTESTQTTTTGRTLLPAAGDMNTLLLGGVAAASTTLVSLGAWRYRRAGGETTTPITTDAGVREWRQPGRDPTQTAAVPTARGLRTHPKTAHKCQPEDGTVATPPAVADERAVVGTTEDELHARPLESGDTDWTVEIDAENLTAPVATEHIVYVGSDDGVHAYGLKGGNERWTAPLGTVTTLLAGDAIYAGTDEGVHALRLTGGSQQWQAECNGRVDALAAGDGTVYGATDATVTALDAETGDQQWTIEARGRNPSLAVGDALVVAIRSGLAVHDPETGDEHWQDDEGGQPTAVALAHGQVYQTTETAVRALDDRTGTESWRTAIDATTGPIVVGDTIYVGTEGDLVALDAEDGEYQFMHDLPGVQSRPAAVGNAILCQTDDGALTTVTAELSTHPELHATTAEHGAEETEMADDAETEEDDAKPTDTQTPTTAAGWFARDCDAIADATLVSDSGPVHVYDGTVTDRGGQQDARIYALAPEHASDETVVDAFETTAREWRGISKNTHVATVLNTGTDPRSWVAFDDGHDRLDEAVAALDRTERVDVIVGLAEAMRTGSMYNLVHSDLTPETVFLAEDRSGDQIATVADWGLERAVREAVAESVVTPYTAPEQLDDENAGGATDVYRLGAVAYRVLAGEPPYADARNLRTAITEGDLRPPTKHDPTLPDAVDDILTEAMVTDPDDRLQPYDLRRRLLGAMDG